MHQIRHGLRTALTGAIALAAIACGGKDATGPAGNGGVGPGNGGASGGSGFAIDLRWVGEAPGVQIQTAFTAAAERWSRVIVGDLPDVNSGASAGAGSCGEPRFPDTRNVTIDDVLIFAEVDSIDGLGKTLGQAKPCFTYQGRTVIGYMTFDKADLATMVANGSIGDVILHEMGHVLGIGTLWCSSLTRACPTTAADTSWIRGTDVRYTAQHGAGAYTGLGGSGGAPVENCATGVPSSCGAGTWYGHWREATFRNELMTGYISATGNPMSAMTIGALRDLGYTVDASKADSYGLPTDALFSGVASSAKRLEEKPYAGPIVELDRTGRVVRHLQ